jgi:transcriptional regulator with XRE-family HTH domain
MRRDRGRPLGAVLRAVREERGESRERLAVDAGLTVGTLARLELGQSDPTWSTVLAIADALGLRLADLGKLVDDAREARGAIEHAAMAPPAGTIALPPSKSRRRHDGTAEPNDHPRRG